MGSTVGSVLAALVGCAPALSQEAIPVRQLTDWKFDPARNRLELSLPSGVTPRHFLLARPARIIVDLPQTQMGKVPAQQTYEGAVRQIRVSQFQPDQTRIVIELSRDAVLDPQQVTIQPLTINPGTTEIASNGASGQRWLIQPLIVGMLPPTGVARLPESRPSPETPRTTAPLSILPEEGIPVPVPPPESSMPVSPQTTENMPPSSGGATPNPSLMPAPSAAVELRPAVPLAAPLGIPISRSNPDSTGQPSAIQAIPTLGTGNLPGGIAQPNLPNSSQGESFPFVSVPSLVQTPSTPLVSPGIQGTSAPRGEQEIPVPPAGSMADPQSLQAAPAPSQPTTIGPVQARPTQQRSSGPSALAQPIPRAPITALPPQQQITERPARGLLAQAIHVLPPGTKPLSSDIASAPQPETTLPRQAVPTVAPLPQQAIEFGQPIPLDPLVAPTAAGQLLIQRSDRTPPTVVATTVPYGASSAPSLPMNTANSRPTMTVAAAPILLAGTVLNLRYAGENPLPLASEVPFQEVLVLQKDVQDASGRVILPAGTPFIGQFETDRSGSRFTAKAIALGDRNYPMQAVSDPIQFPVPDASNQIMTTSAIAGLALGLIGGVPGILAGLVGGATSGAVISQDQAIASFMLQPNQVIQVRLVSDFF